MADVKKDSDRKSQTAAELLAELDGIKKDALASAAKLNALADDLDASVATFEKVVAGTPDTDDQEIADLETTLDGKMNDAILELGPDADPQDSANN